MAILFILCYQQDVLDPPEDCFRMRMIITLLETCGHYFDRGSSKRKLDRFLMHFQRYILSKGVLPLDVEFDLQVSHAAHILQILPLLTLPLKACKHRIIVFR